MTACSQNNVDTKNTNTDDLKNTNTTETMNQVFYINTDETTITGENYEPTGSSPEELVDEYIKALSSNPKSSSLKKVIQDGIKVDKFNFNKDGRLSLYFNTEYTILTGITEVLCRAAIVKTLSQISGVKSVEFYVDGQPLKTNNKKTIGLMSAKDFIDSTSAEDVFVKVYFSNIKGTALKASYLKITYKGNIPIEQLIVERLIEGPIEGKMIKTLPEGTKLNNITTKDGICYVDFNQNFMNKTPGIKDEVVLYSVANSLIELSTINKVQFTIDGVIKKNYGEGIAFDGFFERNLELVEGSK
jgi:germination protein M